MAAEATQHSAITIEVNALNNAYKCGVRHQLKGISLRASSNYCMMQMVFEY